VDIQQAGEADLAGDGETDSSRLLAPTLWTTARRLAARESRWVPWLMSARRAAGGSMIGEIIHDCAVRMPATARAEVITAIVAHIDHLDAHGQRLVTRNSPARTGVRSHARGPDLTRPDTT
jgi:hypothetical protein